VVALLSSSRQRWRQRQQHLTRLNFTTWVDQVMADMKREHSLVRNLWLKLGFEWFDTNEGGFLQLVGGEEGLSKYINYYLMLIHTINRHASSSPHAANHRQAGDDCCEAAPPLMVGTSTIPPSHRSLHLS
jgi:hypothetical protein